MNKQNMITNIVKLIIYKEAEILDNLFSKLIDKNYDLNNHGNIIFIRGNYYEFILRKPNKSIKIKSHILLEKENLFYKTRRDKYNYDCKLIEMYLTKLFNNCDSDNEIKATMPNCINILIKNNDYIDTIPSTNKAPTDNRFIQESNKILPIIEYYCGLHFIY